MNVRVEANRGSENSAGENQRLLVWQVGRAERAEFHDTAWLLREHARVLDFHAWSELPDQPTWQQTPDLIVLLQSFAGEFVSSRLEVLQRKFPLVQVICVLGSYSEGETRSGHPLPRAHRVFWYNAAARLLRGFDACSVGHSPWWSLPDTMTDEERWLSRLAEPPSRINGPVAVLTAVPGMAEPTMELLFQAGAEPQYIGPDSECPTSPFACAIWDASPASRFRPLPLELAVQRVSPAPLLAMFTFPRTQDVEFARAAGASRTVPKLIGADVLLWHVDQLIRSSGPGLRPSEGLRIHNPAA